MDLCRTYDFAIHIRRHTHVVLGARTQPGARCGTADRESPYCSSIASSVGLDDIDRLQRRRCYLVLVGMEFTTGIYHGDCVPRTTCVATYAILRS